MNFSYTSSAAVQAVQWEFGDGSSSSQASVLHAYSNPGSKWVKLTLSLNGGGECQDSLRIMVHDLPTADFSTNGKTHCFTGHELCLTDQSFMGTTTSGYDQRIILWGNGAVNQSQNPQIADQICYGQYPKEGTYQLTVEVQNDKGCEDKWQESITILKDYVPSFSFTLSKAECDGQEVCFENDSEFKDTSIQSFEWIFGDGTKANSNWSSICHKYSSAGTYQASLRTVLKNGCVNTFSQTITLNFTEVKAQFDVLDSLLCYPGPFNLRADKVNGGLFSWDLMDSTQSVIKVFSFSRAAAAYAPYPGKFYVRLRVRLGDCRDTSEVAELNAIGIKADFLPLNKDQCGLKDTVYFYNQTIAHPSASPVYLWQFKDNQAAACSSAAFNCNFDTGFHSKHWYSRLDCYNPKLIATDTVSGCVDSSNAEVSFQRPEDANYELLLKKACIGLKTDYSILFKHQLCNADMELMLDSCRDYWDDFSNMVRYDSVCDSNGWVTPGFAAAVGDTMIFRSADPSDFYIDGSRRCRDTVWKHNWFQLHPEPEAKFKSHRDSCLPVTLSLNYTGKDSLSLVKITADWGNVVEVDSLYRESVPPLQHTYYQEGTEYPTITVEDSFGCYNSYQQVVQMGYYNDFFMDSVLCVGDSVLFTDSVRYWNSTYSHWRMMNGIEQIYWDFGDGLQDTGALVTHGFDSMGKYQVRMATNDWFGCTDTVIKTIYVGGIHADVIKDDFVFLCDQITQFFDSSYHDFPEVSDTIDQYTWWFGDGSIESYLKDPYHYFTRNGSITVSHAVKTVTGCVDTMSFEIYLDGPLPEFEIVSDSVGCVPFTVTVQSQSKRVNHFVWHFGDNNQTTFSHSKDTTLEFTYNEPGIYYIYLEGSDSFYNSSTNNYYSCTEYFPDSSGPAPILKRVVVLPIPEVDIEFNEPICLGQEIIFHSQSDSVYEHFQWLIDNQEQSKDSASIVHVFEQAGMHTVGLKPWYVPNSEFPRACYDSVQKSFEVFEVRADFGYIADERCNAYQFEDSSFRAITHQWNFGHLNSTSKELNPSYSFGKDTGNFLVCLEVSSPEGCVDSSCKWLRSDYYEELKMYNVITPEGDGKNDELIVDVFNHSSYFLQIYNRWGELVFESDNPDYSWNGRRFNQGELLPASEYFYVLEYSFECEDKLHRMEGSVSLIPEN